MLRKRPELARTVIAHRDLLEAQRLEPLPKQMLAQHDGRLASGQALHVRRMLHRRAQWLTPDRWRRWCGVLHGNADGCAHRLGPTNRIGPAAEQHSRLDDGHRVGDLLQLQQSPPRHSLGRIGDKGSWRRRR